MERGCEIKLHCVHCLSFREQNDFIREAIRKAISIQNAEVQRRVELYNPT
jgi:hypothetical protein